MERPILFNTEMVQAILEDRKRTTRRIIKKKYSNTDIELLANKGGTRFVEMQNDAPKDIIREDGSRRVHVKAFSEIKQPYQVGNILYVRETFYQYGEWMTHEIRKEDGENKQKQFFAPKKDKTIYFIDNIPNDIKVLHGYKSGRGYYKRPSLFMPKEAARIFLKVTDVRVERLKDMKEEDALKEGFVSTAKLTDDELDYTGIYAIENFRELWDSLYKIHNQGWEDNPWVWVIEFERINKGEKE